MTKYQRSVTAIVLILLIAFCGTFLFSAWTRNFGRIDTTQVGVFSLSQGSKRIVDGLQQPLRMKLFYAKDFVERSGADQFKELNSLYYYVRDLLRAYELYGGGKLAFEEYDPKPYSDAEEEAERIKITRFGGGNAGFYFGLAVTSERGAEQVVKALFDPTRPFDTAGRSQIEYQISEAIELATKPKKNKLGVLSSLDITGGGMNDMMRQMMAMQGQQVTEPWGTIEVLRRYYEISDVQADAEEIDPELAYLLVVHPKALSDKALYAIDQFVMRGGKLIVAVDPYAPFADPPPRDPRNPMGASGHESSSDLNRLLEAWGVRVPKDKIVGDPNLMQPWGTRRGTTNLVALVDFNEKGPGGGGASGLGINADEPVARGLANPVLAAFAGSIEVTGVEGVTFVPILRTTAEGNTFAIDKYELQFGGPDPQKINEKFSPGASPVTVAGRLTGPFKSAFPEGRPDSPEGPEKADQTDEEKAAAEKAKEDPKQKHVAQCAEPNTVIVIADVDMFSDGLCFRRLLGMLQPFTSNPDLLTNAVDSLAGSSDLMSIRSRGTFDRPFTVVEDIERRADVRTQEQVARINEDIQRFESDLRDLQSQATDQNVGVLRGEAVQKQRDIERQIREKRRELNRVQKEKTDEIESLGSSVQAWNIAGVPAVVLLVGLALAWNQRRKRALAVRGGAA